jgi:iron complex transport system substrate-binding protein
VLSPLVLTLASCEAKNLPSEGERSVLDEKGRALSLPYELRRIISLAPSVTEVLFALGAGERVIGVTSYCNYPMEALAVEKVGDTQKPNLERIIALKPDLVIVSTGSQLEQFVRKLEQHAVPVYICDPRDINGVIGSIERLGDLLAVSENGRELARALRQRIDILEAQVSSAARPRVFFMIASSPLMSIGGGTFVDDLIKRAGGISITANEQSEYPQYSLETAIARKPEVIFFQTGEPLESFPERLKQTPAYASSRVHQIDDDLLLRPGPRIIDGLEQMARAVHPEIFGGDDQ